MTRPTARVLALLEILQAGGTRTVADLAGRLGVDERTVRRYAEHLADLDVPILSVRGRYGGYRLAPGYKMPPLMLTDDEALAVVLGLVAGRRAGVVTTSVAAMESASAKVRRVLPAALGRRLEALLSTTDFTAAARPAPVAPGADVLLLLAEAAQNRRPVAITYTAWRGRSSERTLHPYGLVLHSGRWYVTGADSARDEVRTFRLDRIGTAELAPGTFEVPEDFDPTERVLSGLADVQYPHEVSAVLHTTLEAVRERIPAGLARVTEADGGVRLTLRANRLEWAAAVLAWLGFGFEIERPDALRAEVRALADRLAAGAGPAPGAAARDGDGVVGVSSRAVVRRLRPADAEEFVRLAGQSLDLHRPWITAPTTCEAFAGYLRRFDPPSAEGFVVCDAVTGAITGFVNLNEIVLGPYRRGLLGYGVFTPYARQGYLTEGLRLVMGHAFGELELHRLEADIQPANVASRRLAERAGFRCEGVSAGFIRIDGVWTDHERWAVTRETWPTAP